MLRLKRYLQYPTAAKHISRISSYGQKRFVSSSEVITYDTKDLCGIPGAATLPPYYPSHIAYLKIFELPERITGSASDRLLGRRFIEAWREDGMLHVVVPPRNETFKTAMLECKEFFAQPYAQKAACIDDQSFSGYIALGEELTDGIRDYSETFTVMKDLPNSDPRVQQQWPCHGPCPWPNESFKGAMTNLMNYMGDYGERILKLTAYGLGLEDENTLNNLTLDGWHHVRILR
jgi:isopenicillin N synthase-like dioxygenase